MHNLTFYQVWSQLGFVIKELYDLLSQPEAMMYLVAGFFLLRWLVKHRPQSFS